MGSIERGEKRARLDTLVELAAALDVSLSELFAGVDRDLPLSRDAKRLALSLAGRSIETQRRILRILDEALQLGR